MQREWIETILDLCDSRAFTATADRRGGTQSTVAGRVGALERELGARLFRRGRAGTELTEEGARFAPHARDLRLGWTEALRAVREPATAALTLRLGMQPDLVPGRRQHWLAGRRRAMPDAALYVEAGFSGSMCDDLMAGVLDVALVFTPTTHPDLHVETLADLPYRMVSDRAARLGDVALEGYILPDYSQAFLRGHNAALPGFEQAPLASGQTDLSLAMLRALGGTAYLPEALAAGLIAEGRFARVAGAPVLSQRVYGATHLKNRHRSAHRQALRLMAKAMDGAGEAAIR